jgi:hypothetical protein
VDDRLAAKALAALAREDMKAYRAAVADGSGEVELTKAEKRALYEIRRK